LSFLGRGIFCFRSLWIQNLNNTLFVNGYNNSYIVDKANLFLGMATVANAVDSNTFFHTTTLEAKM